MTMITVFKGDIVLDPVAGSGTTGIASHNTGRDCVLCDKDDTFFSDMVNRLIKEGVCKK